MPTTETNARILSFALASLVISAAACGDASSSQEKRRVSAPVEPGVAARVGEREITLAEVDEKAIAANLRAYQELYDARRAALDELVAEALLEREAAERGISRDELVAREITSNIAAVSDEEVTAFFEQNQARLRGQTLETIGPQIRSYLESRNEMLARESYLDELRESADVTVSLDPPRVPIQVAENERIKGPAGAPVTIVEYSDFQ